MNTTRHTPPERLGLRLPWETETGRTGPCPCGAACAPRDCTRLCWYSDNSRLPKRRSAQCTQGRLRSSSETSSTYYIVRNIPRSGDMPPAKCRKSTQDVRKNAQHPRGTATNSRPTGTQDVSPSKHALCARTPRSPQKPNAMRDRRRRHRAPKRKGAHRARCTTRSPASDCRQAFRVRPISSSSRRESPSR